MAALYAVVNIKHMQEPMPTGTGTSLRHGVRPIKDAGAFAILVVLLLCCG